MAIAVKSRRSMSELAASRPRNLRASYDAAQTTQDNSRLWANADHLSAQAAHSPQVRRVLRARARYEAANNSYCAGMLRTLANDVIGRGSRLQLIANDAGRDTLMAVEADFASWAKQVRLAQKLRQMRICVARDGEAFAVLTTNMALPTKVKLDIRLVDAEQVATPMLATTSPQLSDGIIFDDWGNPLAYQILRRHPGDTSAASARLDADTVPAEQVIHLFRAERPGQSRGVPEITSSIPLYAELRRYTLAVVAAAESAADAAGVISSDAPPETTGDFEPFDAVDIERRQWVTLPQGWGISQIKAEQPTTTYPQFKREILTEIARCLSMPYNVAAGDSSSYNYASGRLDHQTYFKSIDVDRDHIEIVALDRILGAWLGEARRIEGHHARELPEQVRHEWTWDGREHVDPSKEATAQATRLSSNCTTLAAEYAKQGLDWETELYQRARELKRMRELGLPIALPPGSPGVSPAAADDEAEEKDE